MTVWEWCVITTAAVWIKSIVTPVIAHLATQEHTASKVLLHWALSITHLHNSGTGFFNSGMTRMSGFRPCKRTTGSTYFIHVMSQTNLMNRKKRSRRPLHPRAHVDPASRTRRPGRLFARLSHDQTENTPTVQFCRQN